MKVTITKVTIMKEAVTITKEAVTITITTIVTTSVMIMTLTVRLRTLTVHLRTTCRQWLRRPGQGRTYDKLEDVSASMQGGSLLVKGQLLKCSKERPPLVPHLADATALVALLM